MRIRSISILALLVIGIFISSCDQPVSAQVAPSRPAATSPNVVLIVSDDQGYRDLGCYGSEEVLTPNLDRLANEGVRLTNFYAAWPACTPSRASLLTGRYPQRNGMLDMIRNEAPDYGYKYTPAEYAVTFERIAGMDTREMLMPALLNSQGYLSAIFGKWDLGSQQRFLPLARGYHRFYGFVNTGIDYYTHERYGIPSMYRDNLPTEEDRGTYSTDLFLREAEDFLREVHRRRFTLYLPFNAPHSASSLDPVIRSSAQAPEESKALYPELASQAGLQPTERYGRPAQTRNRAGRRLEYVASITHMDRAIGRVLDLLDQYELTEHTIVIFMSDNGGSGISDNGPLRGHKGDLFEGGIRVPAIVRYPAKIPAGQVQDGFCSALDILPTLLRACDIDPPQQSELDGYDLMPMLSGKAPAPRRKMFWQRRDHRAARLGEWKWVDTPEGGGLFNLNEDPGEQVDLSQKNPKQLRRLVNAFQLWQEEMRMAEPRGPFRDY